MFEILYPEKEEYIPMPETIIDFKFESEQGIHKDSLLLILEKEGYIEKRK